ncbi:hypothetical protein TNCV_4764671 [Trichonephila clavipes]|nr:hypothetical protein TNCV_4764671 [Trichonephila clavipes]
MYVGVAKAPTGVQVSRIDKNPFEDCCIDRNMVHDCNNPDPITSDFHHFGPLKKHFGGQHYRVNAEVQQDILTCFHNHDGTNAMINMTMWRSNMSGDGQ